FLVAEAESLKKAIDKKLLDDLCAVYYSIEAIELFSQPLVKNHLFKICIDRTLMIFEEMMQRVDETSQ
ncbi:MAG: hypothetical protein IRZ29_03865, partial [Thermoflavifilum sp.]|nr:hypothetical protein [Thermoflavifilum sp.]